MSSALGRTALDYRSLLAVFSLGRLTTSGRLAYNIDLELAHLGCTAYYPHFAAAVLRDSF